MNEKVKEFLKNSAGYVIVFALSAIYTMTAIVGVVPTGKSVWMIVVDGVLVFLMGVFINQAFEYQGLFDGDRVEKVRDVMKKHIAVVDDVSPYIDELEEWCDRKNREALRSERMRMLAREGLCYSDYFDGDGMARDVRPDEEKLKNKYLRRIERRRMRCFYRALTLKLTPLSAGTLTSEGGRAGDPFYLGRSKLEYVKQSGRGDVITKIILAVIFGYFGVALLEDFSAADLIWKIFQVGVFVMMGSLKRSKAFGFVTDEYCGRITRKTAHITVFIESIKNQEMKSDKEEKDAGDGKQKERTS